MPENRVIYYRTMAAKALRLAQLASDEAQKASYLDIAARWNVLAAEAARRMTLQGEKRDSGPESQSNGDGQ